MIRNNRRATTSRNRSGCDVVIQVRTTEPVVAAVRGLIDHGMELRTLRRNVTVEAAELLSQSYLRKLLASETLEMRPLFQDRTQEIEDHLRAFGATVIGKKAKDKVAGFNLLRFATPEEAEKAKERLKQDSMIENAYLPSMRHLLADTIDPDVNIQWALRKIEYFAARNHPPSGLFIDKPPVKVAVIDSGVDTLHPDIEHRVGQPGFVDAHNFVDDQDDLSGHGTHCVGTIAAIANNSVGIAGMCAPSEILSIKTHAPFDAGAYFDALEFARTNGVKVINLSVGGKGHDDLEARLIQLAIDDGIAIVAAMGNDGSDTPFFPAALPDVIAVGATDEGDHPCGFSNRGAHLCLMAPGNNIFSASPSTHAGSDLHRLSYDNMTGTSAAVPFVSATIALMFGLKPGATLKQIRKALLKGCDPIPGDVKTVGAGRLNVAKSLAAILGL